MGINLVRIGTGKTVHVKGLHGVNQLDAAMMQNGYREPVKLTAHSGCPALSRAIVAGKPLGQFDGEWEEYTEGYREAIQKALTELLERQPGLQACKTCSELLRPSEPYTPTGTVVEPVAPLTAHARRLYADMAKDADTESARNYWARKAVSA